MEGLEATGTDWYANNGGFRSPLLEVAVADGRWIAFVGARESGPAAGQTTPQKHSGFAAIRLADLDRMVPDPMRNFHHNIVLIHAGVYDAASTVVSGGNDTGAFAASMQNIIDSPYLNQEQCELLIKQKSGNIMGLSGFVPWE